MYFRKTRSWKVFNILKKNVVNFEVHLVLQTIARKRTCNVQKSFFFKSIFIGGSKIFEISIFWNEGLFNLANSLIFIVQITPLQKISQTKPNFFHFSQLDIYYRYLVLIKSCRS